MSLYGDPNSGAYAEITSLSRKPTKPGWYADMTFSHPVRGESWERRFGPYSTEHECTDDTHWLYMNEDCDSQRIYHIMEVGDGQ
jgi:hypothetical protein